MSTESRQRFRENACPLDDRGGIDGYYNLREILADPKHPEHADMKDWVGGEFDGAWFDLSGLNSEMKRLKA